MTHGYQRNTMLCLQIWGEVFMEVVYSRCAGLDVHKKTVVACAITPKSTGGCHKEIKTFGTMTSNLLELSDWLMARECTHVAFGLYWRILATSI
ncbi:hypothetical protein H6G91_38980 [Nostoc muscorum FACHB-395]|nr:hypothetical protein [Desmonostoc muscorum FACHB-395]